MNTEAGSMQLAGEGSGSLLLQGSFSSWAGAKTHSKPPKEEEFQNSHTVAYPVPHSKDLVASIFQALSRLGATYAQAWC